MGHINPTTQRAIHHSDQFFLGGMSGSLRGFKKCSIGEYKDACALGGTTYWSVGVHLYSRIDFLSKVTGGIFQVSNYLSNYLIYINLNDDFLPSNNSAFVHDFNLF